MTKVLVTGGSGFVGHHLIRKLLENTDWDLSIFDCLTYASYGLDRLNEINALCNSRARIFTIDFSRPIPSGIQKEVGSLDYIFHLGAETFVDRSIKQPELFASTNILGTLNLLEFARLQPNLKHFIYFSTDEVFGPATNDLSFKEWDRYNCTNPYSATKAGAEEMVLAFSNTFDIPVMIIHSMNIYGERQHPEKYIPKCIRYILSNDTIPVHSNQQRTQPGSRFYIHCDSLIEAVMFLIEKSIQKAHSDQINWKRDKFNIVGEREVNNLEIASQIAKIIGKPLYYELVDYHSQRPGHDLRYALDGSRMEKLGWSLHDQFDSNFEKTVRWTLENPQWFLKN